MPAVTTWKTDVLHLLHVCHVPWKTEQSVDIAVLGRLFWKLSCTPCTLSNCSGVPSRRSVSSIRITCTLHTHMDFAKATRLNEANRR